jgi:hypothetical protein
MNTPKHPSHPDDQHDNSGATLGWFIFLVFALLAGGVALFSFNAHWDAVFKINQPTPAAPVTRPRKDYVTAPPDDAVPLVGDSFDSTKWQIKSHDHFTVYIPGLNKKWSVEQLLEEPKATLKFKDAAGRLVLVGDGFVMEEELP